MLVVTVTSPFFVTDSPQSQWGKIRVGAPTKQLTINEGCWFSPLGSPFLPKEPESQGRACHTVLHSPGKGQRSQGRAASLPFLMHIVLVSEV